MDVELHETNALANYVNSLITLAAKKSYVNLRDFKKNTTLALKESVRLIEIYQAPLQIIKLSQWYSVCNKHEKLLSKIIFILTEYFKSICDKSLELQLDSFEGHLDTVRNALWILRGHHHVRVKGHEKVELVKKCFMESVSADDKKRIKEIVHPNEVPGIFWRLEHVESINGKKLYTFEQLKNMKQRVYQILAKPEAIARNEHLWRVVRVIIAAIFLTPFSLIWTWPWLKEKRQDVIVTKSISTEEFEQVQRLRCSLKNSPEKIMLVNQLHDEKEEKHEINTLCNKSGELRKWFQERTTLFMTVNQAQRFNLVAEASRSPLSPEERARLQTEIKESKNASCRQVLLGSDRLRI
jgi:hypothetical protein